MGPQEWLAHGPDCWLFLEHWTGDPETGVQEAMCSESAHLPSLAWDPWCQEFTKVSSRTQPPIVSGASLPSPLHAVPPATPGVALTT